MNPANYRLSKEVLQEMLEEDYNKKFHQFETIYDRQVKGQSPADVSQKWLDDFFVRLSDPLKKMQSEYLTTASKNCYKDKHLSDSEPNLEQITLCKETERAKIFGGFEKMLVAHRDSSRFQFQDCIVEANNNVEKAVYCVRDYNKHIQEDNDKMIEIFKKDYAKYV
jgi:hypothetical protein